MRVLNMMESEYVVGGSLDSNLKVISVTLISGTLGGLITGDLSDAFLCAFLGLIVSSIFVHMPFNFEAMPIGC